MAEDLSVSVIVDISAPSKSYLSIFILKDTKLLTILANSLLSNPFEILTAET